MTYKYTGPVPQINLKHAAFAPISLGAVQSGTNPAKQLLNALWSSPDEKYQIGALDRGTKKFRNIPVKSIDEADQLAHRLSAEGEEAYFAIAGYETSGNRTTSNSSGAGGFWMDLDCGVEKASAGKGYLTTQDAEQAVLRFSTAIGIPTPTYIVDSGGGLHVYWVFDNFLHRDPWLAYAKKFKSLAQSHGLLADPTRTADIASVLRLPGTLNYKYTPPRPVTILHASDETISTHATLDAINKAYKCLPGEAGGQRETRIEQPATSSGNFSNNSTDSSENNWSVGRLAALLKHIDPEEGGRPAWIVIGMALHNVTGGSGEGLEFFDHWSKPGKTYPGRHAIEVQWRSFNSDSEKRHNIGTIINRVKAAKRDWMAICSELDDPFEHCETEIVGLATLPAGDHTATVSQATLKTPAICPAVGNVLDRYILNDQLEKIEAQAVEQKPILGKFALYGQATVIYALPNVGKTVIVMSEIISSINAGIINPEDLYYINNDDTTASLAEKLRIANEYGFKMISETFQEFQASDFLNILDDLVEEGQARGKIIILDTLTKFVDVLHAAQARGFTKHIRKFVLQGGSLIALAHANKNPGTDGKTVYRGTTDIMNDFDCAYVLSQLQADASEKIVAFDSKKRRGNVAQSVAYSYSTESGISYHELLASVKEVDATKIDEFQQADTLRSDAELIAVVQSCVTRGVNTKMLLADESAKLAGVSKRAAMKIIEKYTGENPAVHRWLFTVRDRGAKVYTLLDATLPPAQEPSKAT